MGLMHHSPRTRYFALLGLILEVESDLLDGGGDVGELTFLNLAQLEHVHGRTMNNPVMEVQIHVVQGSN